MSNDNKVKDTVEKLRCAIGYEYSSIDGQLLEDAADAIESLTRQLAEVTAERDAAVEDLKIACTVGEPCFICKHGCNRGDQFPCSVSDDWCKGEKWTYRGRKSNG